MNNLHRTLATLVLMLVSGLSQTAGAANVPNQDAAKSPASQGKQDQKGQQGAAAQDAQAEQQAFMAIQNELDPDRTIQLVDDFAKKFPASSMLSYAYLKGAFACRQKGEVPRIIEYGEKSVKAKGDNPVALILVASTLPEPQSLQGNDLDKEKKLTEAAEYGSRALELVDKMPKQPNMTDEQHHQMKASLTGWAHSSLGLVHLQRSGMALEGVDKAELAKAQQEYKTAVTVSSQPEPGDYYRLGEAYSQDGKTDEAIEAFSKASQLDQSGQLKKLADQQVELLKKRKSEVKPPAKP